MYGNPAEQHYSAALVREKKTAIRGDPEAFNVFISESYLEDTTAGLI
eukprot:COSAG02_NODE_8245_length_2644_cov_1.804322_1_plen_46_part_10